MVNSLFIIKLFFFRYRYQIELVFFPKVSLKLFALENLNFGYPS